MGSTNLPPPHTEPFDALVRLCDSMGTRGGSPPPLFVVAGNTDGFVHHLSTGALNVPGVNVFTIGADSPDPAPVRSGLFPRGAGPDVVDKTIAAGGEALELLVRPYLGLLVALGDLGVAIARRWKEQGAADLARQDLLTEVLAEIRSVYPASVVAISGLSDTQLEVAWLTLLGWSHQAYTSENELLAVLAIRRDTAVDLFAAGHAPDGILAKIQNTSLTEPHWLPPLSDVRLRQWLGRVDDDVAATITNLSGRDDQAAGVLWARFRDEGVVHQVDGVWKASDIQDSLVREMTGRIGEKLSSLTDGPWERTEPLHYAFLLLKLAGISGQTFSASVVSELVAADDPLVSADDVIDVLDLLGPDNDGWWLVEPDEGAAVQVNDQWHWRYRFASPLIARYFAGLGFQKRTAGGSIEWVPSDLLPGRLHQTGLRLHGPHVLFEEAMATLALKTGDADLIKFHETRRSNEAKRTTLIARAIAYLQLPAPDPVLLDDIIDTVLDLTYARSSISLTLGDKTASDAMALGTDMQQADALRVYGTALFWAGRANDAVVTLRQAVDRYQKLSESLPGEFAEPLPLTRRRAVTLQSLGDAFWGRGDFGEAVGFLEQAEALSREVLATDPNSPTHKQDLAATLSSLGKVFWGRGDFGEAVGFLEQAEALSREVLATDPNSPTHKQDLAATLSSLGRVFWGRGDFGEAVGFLEQAEALSREVLATDPNSPTHKQDLAATLSSLGRVFWGRGDFGEAVGFLEQAEALSREVLATDPNSPTHKRELAATLHSLGDAFRGRGDFGEAVGFLEQAEALFREVLATDPNSPTHKRALAATLSSLGKVFWGRGDFGEAVGFLEQAEALFREVLATDPNSPTHKRNLAVTLYSLGEAFRGRGDFGEAVGFLEQAEALFREVLATDPNSPTHKRELAATLYSLGDVFGGRGDFGEAVGFLEQAEALFREVLATDPNSPTHKRNLAATLYSLGKVFWGRGDFGEAVGFLEQAEALLREVLATDPNSPTHKRNLAVTLYSLGDVFGGRGDFGEAVGFLEQAEALFREVLATDPNSPSHKRSLAITLQSLGDAYGDLGQDEAARRCLEEAAALSGES